MGPTVYVPPDSPSVPNKDRRRWFTLIERALCVEPSDQWPDAGALRDALGDLLATSRLEGVIAINYFRGRRPQLLRTPAGDLSAGWLVNYVHSEIWNRADSL